MVLAGDSYRSCLTDEARRLEPSGEAAPVIARAAATACSTVRQEATEVVALWGVVNEGLPTEDAVGVALRVMARLERETLAAIELDITSRRAERTE
jgi:hypothetical protein